MKLLVKLGGTLLESDEHRASLADQFKRLSHEGHHVVVVHGGGKRLSRYLEGLDHVSEFRNGLRVTPPVILDAVLRVLAGSVNHQLVANMQRAGLQAVGLSGIDAGTVVASQMDPELGSVGKVEHVNPALLETLVGCGYLPVVACIAGGENGAIYNVNADQMAAACAAALQVDCLVFLTDVGGVLDAEHNPIANLTAGMAGELIANKTAVGGMEAKLQAARIALKSGIQRISIVNGHEPDVLARTVQATNSGTLITA